MDLHKICGLLCNCQEVSDILCVFLRKGIWSMVGVAAGGVTWANATPVDIKVPVGINPNAGYTWLCTAGLAPIAVICPGVAVAIRVSNHQKIPA